MTVFYLSCSNRCVVIPYCDSEMGYNLPHASSTTLHCSLLPLSSTFNRENSFHIPFPFLPSLFLVGPKECGKVSPFSLGSLGLLGRYDSNQASVMALPSFQHWPRSQQGMKERCHGQRATAGGKAVLRVCVDSFSSP